MPEAPAQKAGAFQLAQQRSSEWTLVGVAVGLLYKSAAPAAH
jgi:hypothetical protein